jgi:uncharacterized membrane protein YphA (DoxX/SURF4 family)
MATPSLAVVQRVSQRFWQPLEFLRHMLWLGVTSLIEFVGGICLMAGAFVLPLCLPLALVMLTALFSVHLQYPVFVGPAQGRHRFGCRVWTDRL